MDLAPNSVKHCPEKFEDVNYKVPMFHCNLFDAELVHKIAQVFLPGLASACVDNTTGDIFRRPATVAVDIRKEMVNYLTQRSEAFVAETLILEDGTVASYHPFDIISEFVDDFASSKMNMFSQVTGWLLSDRREDKIDDFVQEMEMTGFWQLDRRMAIAQTLLKNVDFRNIFYCNIKCDTSEELAEHGRQCGFRSMHCENEGCNDSFCATSAENHDSLCPFKIISCEQNCPARIMRRQMDRHCITVCPMKLVNCPFYSVGCQSTIAHSMIEKHQLDNLHSHLLHILRVLHKDANAEELRIWTEQLEKLASPAQLAAAKDVRALMSMVKSLEQTHGPFKSSTTDKINDEGSSQPQDE